jgi:hypothetical protein
MRISVARAGAVTLGLGAVGLLCGALLGGVAMIVDMWRGPEGAMSSFRGGFWFGAVLGALFGVVLTPAVGWIFLRRVSLRRAIAQTALGVLAGIAVGAVVFPTFSIHLGLLGFLIAGIRLWFATRRAVVRV